MLRKNLLRYYSTCKYLELIPQERERRTLIALAWEINQSYDNSPEETEGHIESLVGPLDLAHCRMFSPWCKKHNFCCGLAESVVIGEETPLTILLSNIARLEKCDSRKPDKFPKKLLFKWLLDYLNLEEIEA